MKSIGLTDRRAEDTARLETGRRTGNSGGSGKNAIIPRGPPVAKAPYENGSDCEGRKLGERSGLDTRVVLAVNAASKALHVPREYAVSKRSR